MLLRVCACLPTAPKCGTAVPGCVLQDSGWRHLWLAPSAAMALQLTHALLQAPAFALVVFAMSWSLPLSNLCLCIKSWKLCGGRNDMYQW